MLGAMRRSSVLLLAAVWLFSGCAGAPREVLIVNGRLYGKAGARAVLIRGNKIHASGEPGKVRRQASEGAEEIDARGGLILPGLQDAHTHLLAGGLAMGKLSLAGVRNLDEAVERVRRYAEKHPDEEWIVGGGWNYDLVAKGTFPSRRALDKAVSDRPVALESYDGHSYWLNSQGLSHAEITADTPDPKGGRIVRERGSREPQGTLLEDAIELIAEALPEPSREERRRALEIALRYYLENGITSILNIVYDLDELVMLEEFRRKKKLPIRVTVALPLEGSIEHSQTLRERHKSPFLRVGPLKGFVDGVIESKTAYMVEPYAGSADRGEPLFTLEELSERVSLAHSKGFSVALHAIGDAAVRLALDAFEHARRANPLIAARHRIEHIEVVHPDDLPRFKKLDVTASMQPYHVEPGPESDEGAWTENVGPDRLKHSFAWKELSDHGAVLAFGSDWNVMTANPLAGLAVAVTRQDPQGRPKGGWQGHQALSLEQAVRAYTYGASYGLGREKELGTLKPGQLADIIILSPDVNPERPETLWKGKVQIVLVDGIVRYRAR